LFRDAPPHFFPVMRRSEVADAPARHPSIISPVVDFLCVGGLSLIVLIPLLVIGPDQLTFLNVGWLVWVLAVINYAHFMASYRIVYRDREMIRRHQWAAIWVPLIMLALLVLAVATVEQSQILLIAFFAVASGYLAWHYTGQSWGMMASYAHLGGARFEKTERTMIRTSLRILLVWHLVWFFHTTMKDPSRVEPAYRLMGAATVFAFLLGAAGLVRLRRRIGRFPPARAVVAWVAIFFWYAALARWGVAALVLVQLFHAIQYLEFPGRVEINRAARTDKRRVSTQLVIYVAALLGASAVVLLIVPGPAMSVMANLLGAPPTTVVPVLILYFINIHHYFTDGVIWKISNPDVRKDLFAHVQAPTS
jgi:hypothetical protein